MPKIINVVLKIRDVPTKYLWGGHKNVVTQYMFMKNSQKFIRNRYVHRGVKIWIVKDTLAKSNTISYRYLDHFQRYRDP